MKKQTGKLNVFVLMGGPSAEHDVSLKSGVMVLKNLNPKKFNATPSLITKSGKWARPELAQNTTTQTRSKTSSLQVPTNTIAFIAMHGTYGEDGTVQGLLEIANIPYTGSGVTASALAMDKTLSAKIFQNKGVGVPEFISFDKVEWRENKIQLIANIKKIGLPLVIKPSDLGSSVGVTIIKKNDELLKAVRLAFKYSARIMAQKYINGRELTCGVIDSGSPGTEIALKPTEIIPKKSAFFDYSAKYTPGASEEITPPNLPNALIKKIQQTALLCHRALGCSGMSRTDMILVTSSDKNNKAKKLKHELYVLEVNTIPGMTETSLLPQGAKASGITFPQLLERIINAAMNRSRSNA